MTVRRFASMVVVGASLALLAGSGCERRAAGSWSLTDVTGHLPNLQFILATKDNPKLTATDLRGKIVLLYFGYTHCPDVCPMTMARLAGVVRELGANAAKVAILFVSVDPARDTPESVATYARAFSPSAIGATASPGEVETLARRYRVAYQAEPPGPDGNYEVMHSKAVYVFDGSGRARLLISDTDPPQAIGHDLRALLQSH